VGKKFGTFSSPPLPMKSNRRQKSSIERRIQRFFKFFVFDFQKVCLLLLSFLPLGKLVLSIDRAAWNFGKYSCNINILMIAVNWGGVGIPLYCY
jgi:hypothetical protein